MNNWNRLLAALDETIGFPNRISSTVKKRWQGFDQWKNEHVILIEYRTKVHPGVYAPATGPKTLGDLHSKPKRVIPRRPLGPMATIRELMDAGWRTPSP